MCGDVCYVCKWVCIVFLPIGNLTSKTECLEGGVNAFWQLMGEARWGGEEDWRTEVSGYGNYLNVSASHWGLKQRMSWFVGKDRMCKCEPFELEVPLGHVHVDI